MKLYSIFCSIVLFSCASKAPQDAAEAPVLAPSITAKAPVVKATNVKEGEITRVETDQLFSMISADQVLLFDSRPKLYYVMGHINGAESWAPKDFEKRYLDYKPRLDAAVQSGKVIVLYCLNVECPDAYKVAKRLAADGYHTSIYKDGWEEWQRSGLADM
ncbi:MAG: rhodanese-like domain-containing protein [Akkermansiaceae bacterium]